VAGTFRRALVIGAAIVGGLTACGQTVDRIGATTVPASTSPSKVAVHNAPLPSGSSYGTNVGTTSMVEQPLTPLQRRTTGDIQLRIFTTPSVKGDGQCPPNSQCVPDWCLPTGMLIAEVSNDAMASVQGGSVIGLEQGSQVSLLSSLLIGTAEHRPVQLVMVRVAGDISQIRLTTPGGSDTAAPVDGLGVLAAATSSDQGTVVLLDSDGHLRGSVKLPQASTAETSACAAQPPPLPKPGQQPADPALAEKSVRAAYTKAFTAVPNDTSYSSLSAVQGGDGLHAVLDRLRHNFAKAAASSSVDIGQLVFTNPQTAVLKFTLHYTGGAPYGTRNGSAVFENGAWLVSRDTYCAVMAFGSAPCPRS
jgi:hypothetical protein